MNNPNTYIVSQNTVFFAWLWWPPAISPPLPQKVNLNPYPPYNPYPISFPLSILLPFCIPAILSPVELSDMQLIAPWQLPESINLTATTRQQGQAGSSTIPHHILQVSHPLWSSRLSPWQRLLSPSLQDTIRWTAWHAPLVNASHHV